MSSFELGGWPTWDGHPRPKTRRVKTLITRWSPFRIGKPAWVLLSGIPLTCGASAEYPCEWGWAKILTSSPLWMGLRNSLFGIETWGTGNYRRGENWIYEDVHHAFSLLVCLNQTVQFSSNLDIASETMLILLFLAHTLILEGSLFERLVWLNGRHGTHLAWSLLCLYKLIHRAWRASIKTSSLQGWGQLDSTRLILGLWYYFRSQIL